MTMTMPQKYYRFRKLQDIPGVKQITKVKEYKNAPDDLVDKRAVCGDVHAVARPRHGAGDQG